MKNLWFAAPVAVLLLAAACASNPTRTARSEFEDIPVPRGLEYQADQSTIIESTSVKAARLLYRGRVQVDSLGPAMRSTLEANGWRHVSSTVLQNHGVTQVYEKTGNSLQVNIWEGGLFGWYTYVEMTAGRYQGPKSALNNS